MADGVLLSVHWAIVPINLPCVLFTAGALIRHRVIGGQRRIELFSRKRPVGK